MKTILFSLAVFCFTMTAFAQPTCGGFFFDSGGPGGNYLNGSTSVWTICPESPGDFVTVTFSEFDIQANSDGLYVFEGSSTSAPMISSGNPANNIPGGLPGAYWGTAIPGPFTSASPDGCLTFQFVSDAQTNGTGWEAVISCGPAPGCMAPSSLSAVQTETNLVFNWTENGFATSWEVLALPCGAPNPSSNTSGIATSENPFVFENLMPDECYSLFVRSSCEDGESYWVGPLTVGTGDQFLMSAFQDLNANGVRDAGEPDFTQGHFTVVEDGNGPVSGLLYSANMAYFLNPDQNATYTISYELNEPYGSYYTTTPLNFTGVSAQDAVGTQQFTFAVSATSTLTDAEVLSWNLDMPRPGFNHHRTVRIKNSGQTVISGTMNFSIDQGLTIVSASPSGTISGNNFGYTFSNLLPGDYINVIISALVPLTATAGNLVNSTATVTVAGDGIPQNNTSSDTDVIVNSYDPNDISESHGPEIAVDGFGDSGWLYYLIRFQNTGSADAIDIRVENMLDDQLDASSFQMLDASHPYVAGRDGNMLKWLFGNIHLTWEDNDEPASHGWIFYRVRTQPGIEAGDVIPATAEIYFDFNPAIVTETYTTTFVDALQAQEFAAGQAVLYPNPAKETVTVDLGDDQESIAGVKITDLLGKTVLPRHGNGQSQTQLDVSGLASGLYLLEIETDSHFRIVRKLMIR